MRWMRVILLAWSLAVAGVTSASACPMCKDAVANAEAEDQNANLPRMYNQSIYLMVSVPYMCLGFVGFLIYRGCKKNEAFRAAQARTNGVPSAATN